MHATWRGILFHNQNPVDQDPPPNHQMNKRKIRGVAFLLALTMTTNCSGKMQRLPVL